MEGGCSCSYDSSESPEVIDTSYPKARKEHKCCECGSTIAPGDVYERVWGVWESEMETFKTCIPCSRIRSDHCFNYGGLADQVWEFLGVSLMTGKIRGDD